MGNYAHLRHLLEVSVLVFAVGLQDDGDDGHERFDHTELKSGLLTEAQEADGVRLSPQTAGTVHTAGPDGTVYTHTYISDGELSVVAAGERALNLLIERSCFMPGWKQIWFKRMWKSETYSMGFPLISAMMELSPPRYS